jgi:hypothetical protein
MSDPESKGTPVWVTILLAVLTLVGTITSALIAHGYFDLKQKNEEQKQDLNQTQSRLRTATSDLNAARQQLNTPPAVRVSQPSDEKVEPPTQPAEFSQTVGDFTVDLEKCTKQESKSVTCTFGVTNLKPDRGVAVVSTAYGKASYYVDNHGMQRVADSVTFGSGQGGTGTDAVTGVKIPGSLTFPGVEAGVDSLAKLVIWIDLGNFVHYTAEFRKVPLP